MTRFAAVTPRDEKIMIDADEDVFVCGNNGAADFAVSSCALRADDATRKNWSQMSDHVSVDTALFFVRASDMYEYETTHDFIREDGEEV